MPTYEYCCQECGETFELVEHVEEHETHQPVCPGCGSKKVTRVLGDFFAKTSRKS